MSNEASILKKVLVERYNQVIRKREALWRDLKKIPDDVNWIQKRISEHQWSIDEVLRHLLGSEIVYVQQPIDDSIKQHEHTVPAQWVGKVFFRFEEKEHLELDEIIQSFKEVQDASMKIMENWNKDIFETMVEAPWKALWPYKASITHFIDHEISHMGQIYFMLTYFRGPPEFESNWFD